MVRRVIQVTAGAWLAAASVTSPAGWAEPVVASAAAAGPVSGSQPPVGQGRRWIVWSACGDGLQCGKLSVPVDWRRPRGEITQVDVAKMPARSRGLGALVVNTGDGSTIQGVRARPDTVSELARWFDVVFLEPRGVGDRGSRGTVRCSVPQPDPMRLRLASGVAQWRAYARDNAAYDRSCRIAAGPRYAGLTSWQVAHDLDALRGALGEERLRYFGNAYGAVYGQAYLELFPRRAGRMYLEGVPDHTEPGAGRRMIERARAVERQLLHFRDWCRSRWGCPLGGDAVAVLDRLLVRAPDDRRIVAAVYAGLVPQRWPELAHALAAAGKGDSRALAAMAAVAEPVAPALVTRAMACHDFMPVVPGYRRFLAMEKRLRAVAPRVGWMSGRHEIAPCLGLSRQGPSWPPHRPRMGKKVLVGAGRLDIVAPASAKGIPGAVVLWHGDGHGAYLEQGAGKLRATCLRARVHDYLVNGELPGRLTSCPGDLTSDLRPWTGPPGR